MIDLDRLINIFTNNGYIAVFGILLLCGFGLPIPEDVSLVAGGIICGLEDTHMNVHIMLVVCLAGVLIGDSSMFMIGRILGNKIFDKPIGKRLLSSNRYDTIKKWLDRYGKWFLFAARFMPGLRSPIFVTTGVTRFASYRTFLLIDGSAALISVPFWVYLGYFGAKNRVWLMTWLTRGQIGIFVLVLIVVLFIVLKTIIKKRINKKLGIEEATTKENT